MRSQEHSTRAHLFSPAGLDQPSGSGGGRVRRACASTTGQGRCRHQVGPEQVGSSATQAKGQGGGGASDAAKQRAAKQSECLRLAQASVIDTWGGTGSPNCHFVPSCLSANPPSAVPGPRADLSTPGSLLGGLAVALEVWY